MSNLCYNCLKKRHYNKACKSGSCRKCRGRHHTMLHLEREGFNSQPVVPSTSAAAPEATNEVEEPRVALSSVTISSKQVLLSTACVLILDCHGKSHMIRALLDCGSQSSFITARLCNLLKIKTEKTNLAVSGLSQLTSISKGKCMIQISSLRKTFIANLSCFLLPQITGNIPNFGFDTANLKIPSNITLADPTFNEPGTVDLLIGADCFWDLMCVGQIKLDPNQPILQKTKFGWVVSGPVGSSHLKQVTCNFGKSVENQVHEQLARFWELEECSNSKPLSQEEIACESHFVRTTKRTETGRFVVSIPFKNDTKLIGSSMEPVKRRFWSLEKKLQVNPILRERYTQFMLEYESLGHMSKISNNCQSEVAYYMPHHGVLREDSLTTKLRVVFNGSFSTDTGYSINDLQMVGPVIQNDLFSIILRFRKHRYVVSADIQKMYRQVLIEPSQRSLQRIVWRSAPSHPLDTYELNTVTYGTASASLLSIRCLYQLADDCQHETPHIAKIIKNDFYVDDMLTGASSIAALTDICAQVTKVLQGGCFELRKWITNNPQILRGLGGNRGVAENTLDLGPHENTKTLGLTWASHSDVLIYNINKSRENKFVTKRAISQIFDPLGLLSPCIVTAKMLLQELWQEKLSWDESLPSHLNLKWLKFRNELAELNKIRIPRAVLCENPIRVEIHGFSDSSQGAYGGCVFLRSINIQGNVVVRLLCAKTKVAPLKKLTIPRLELCGALILARLADKIKGSLDLELDGCTLWCDSTIVLGWLKTAPSLLKTFVGNRVAEIQALSEVDSWRHVPTNDNPADLLSRGVDPSKLEESSIWWYGPQWLSKNESVWPTINLSVEGLPEIRTNVQTFHTTQHEPLINLSKYSDLSKLERILAYWLRLKDNLRTRKTGKPQTFGPISASESRRALTSLIKISQYESYPREITDLGHGRSISAKSKILSLNPFLDNDGVLRVGGRLENSKFSYDKRHPMILDGQNHLTKLAFQREHLKLLHAGPQLLLAAIREQFWPSYGRNLAKKVVRECVRCFRIRPKTVNPIMGNLPETRVSPAFPFSITGVDYAGPFTIKDRKGRGCKTTKCYLSLFICFTTKAVDLELVTDLTKDSFILALRRFVSRRGKPSDIYSDNGTNFVGADAELKNLGNFLKAQEKDLTQSLNNEGVNWHFIPAHSPHFGGLWEAGVKAAKHHLKRVVGNALLTFEELYTILVQIESILNSRPLSPLSSDPNDPTPLTPAHFLIVRPLTSLPDPDVRDVAENRLTLFRRLQQIVQHFWSRWSKEYVSELQQRTKWKSSTPNITEGSLVIIKDDNLPPMKWLLGGVVRLYPGSDGVVRVVDIKTANGQYKRSIAKVCALPLSD